MNNTVGMTKKHMGLLKKAEVLVVRLLTYDRPQIEWETLDEILWLIRTVGGQTKEYQEPRAYIGGFRQWAKNLINS